MKQLASKKYKYMINYKEFNFFKSIEDYKNAFEKFKEENGHYPSANEIDITPYLPSSRTIQRNFSGGLIELRKKIGLEETDYRSGHIRQNILTTLYEKSLISENEVYKILINKYGEEKIHRQEPYTYDLVNLLRSDFGIYLNRHFYIDVFNPTDEKSLIGCINAKLAKLKKYNLSPDLYFLIGNKEINNNWIESKPKIKTKKLKIPENIKLITYEDFETLINNNFVV